MEPYDPIPGRVPRKVAIDRKKKEYASFDINEIFREQEIDFLSDAKETWLKLEFFDDSTYDDYPKEGWIAKKIDQDGNHRKLTGKGLKITGNESWEYEPVEIIDYDRQTDLFSVIWKKDKSEGELQRIYLCFDA